MGAIVVAFIGGLWCADAISSKVFFGLTIPICLISALF